MTTNVANTATVRRFIFVILSVLKVFCFALRSSERVVLRVVLCSAGATFFCSAGAECFFAPQEQRFFAPQEQRFFAPQEQNVSWLRRSRMFIAACALTRHSGGVRCGDHCFDHSRCRFNGWTLPIAGELFGPSKNIWLLNHSSPGAVAGISYAPSDVITRAFTLSRR